LYLFGYSGGGQFVHRYTLAHPERVAAVAIGAAGWYTFPDESQDYPWGIRETAALPGARFDPESFLRVPACVLVGENDTRRDRELNQSHRLDRQQGQTRLERGRRWVDAMRAAARARGLDTAYRFEVLPDSAHSFTRSDRHGKITARAFRCLFSAPPARPPGGEAGRDPAQAEARPAS
jgi:pimeloyl-ACP methyl ester carboxylesterase